MTALFVTVFLTSLLGSTHCAGMCGAFMLFAIGVDGTRERDTLREVRLHACYHGGRLVTYTLLGVIAGTIGAGVDLGGSVVGLNRAAAILTGATMIVFGVAGIARATGRRVPAPGVPKVMKRGVKRGFDRAARLPAPGRALVTGLLTTLLPCGWLYAFVIVSAGTASPIFGALCMVAFWVGTLPVMLTLGAGVRRLLGGLGTRLPLVGALAMIAVGTMALVARVDMIETTPRMLERDAPERGNGLILDIETHCFPPEG